MDVSRLLKTLLNPHILLRVECRHHLLTSKQTAVPWDLGSIAKKVVVSSQWDQLEMGVPWTKVLTLCKDHESKNSERTNLMEINPKIIMAPWPIIKMLRQSIQFKIKVQTLQIKTLPSDSRRPDLRNLKTIEQTSRPIFHPKDRTFQERRQSQSQSQITRTSASWLPSMPNLPAVNNFSNNLRTNRAVLSNIKKSQNNCR